FTLSSTSFLTIIPFSSLAFSFFFFNDSSTTEIYTLSLHDALPIFNEDNVFHFVAGIQFHSAYVHLAAQCRVCTQQQLLSGLTLGIESTGYLSTTERTVVQCTAVFEGERNTLCNALGDNIVGYCSQTVNVGFAGTVVATLYCIVAQTVYRVTVVLVILSSIDTTLCSDGVCTARRVLDAEVEYSETHFAQRGGSTGTGKSGSY